MKSTIRWSRITNLAFLLVHHEPLDDEARKYAELLLREVQRAGEITRQTLSYHRASRERTQVNIAEILEHIARWKKKKLDAKGIELRLEIKDPPLVSGYAGELRQVFDNLIENAIDALSAGGTIRVRARGRRVGPTQRLLVSVCDNGEGIPRPLVVQDLRSVLHHETKNRQRAWSLGDARDRAETRWNHTRTQCPTHRSDTGRYSPSCCLPQLHPPSATKRCSYPRAHRTRPAVFLWVEICLLSFL